MPRATDLGLLPFLALRSAALADFTLQPTPALEHVVYPRIPWMPPRPADHSLPNFKQLRKTSFPCRWPSSHSAPISPSPLYSCRLVRSFHPIRNLFPSELFIMFKADIAHWYKKVYLEPSQSISSRCLPTSTTSSIPLSQLSTDTGGVVQTMPASQSSTLIYARIPAPLLSTAASPRHNLSDGWVNIIYLVNRSTHTTFLHLARFGTGVCRILRLNPLCYLTYDDGTFRHCQTTHVSS